MILCLRGERLERVSKLQVNESDKSDDNNSSSPGLWPEAPLEGPRAFRGPQGRYEMFNLHSYPHPVSDALPVQLGKYVNFLACL